MTENGKIGGTGRFNASQLEWRIREEMYGN
jgi:hypothetical protein